MMKAKAIGWVMLGVWVAATCAAETIYRETDAKGRPVFTDQPQPGAKTVDLPPVNTTPGVAPPSPASSPARDEFAGYRRVALVVPGSIPNGLTPVTVGISIEPGLHTGHSWQLGFDGQIIAQGRDATYTFPRLERGSHQLSLKVVDAAGAEQASAAPVDVFVFWPGKNR